MIPYGRQDIQDDDIAAVVEVLRSDFLTQGPKVPAFEAAVASHCGVAHALAVNSATSALHIACLALGVGRGDLVWTSPITFVASANCALYCGAEIDFVDIDPATFNLCPKALKEKLDVAKAAGKLPKVVIPVHMTGQSCDMASIRELSFQYGFAVIEDASHAIGGRYRDTVIGSCAYSDITVFSFHPVKIITTAEGGMALTQNADLARSMALLRSHGITREASLMEEESHGPWYYEQQALGYNYRMTDMQAALGVSQMKHLDAWVARRQVLADRYDQLLRDLPVIAPVRVSDRYSALHLYVIQLDQDKTGKSRREVFESLRAAGVGVNVHYIPVHLQPYYKRLGFTAGQYPLSEAYYARAISLPMFPKMTEQQQDTVVNALKQALS
ncbi:MAG: UDP-4-amino-4,6-dideoxy-N-acetyl-beta-L-altrosamine transaminase [Fluviicoccus sp.]|uniref:UDP-4-amino-4, 6-dideoxy-N-acetyl-beta-L-altrosamine transaminase n=1 Tax=Fluviicoccus sp. TaxID=2003552 RepID=UPI00271652DA|nr:UDP-4-amino-4,6-dideoxy-N-acetyl-beta-L-altrosamine transaminase [Fluviicoccus sp.]MDO8330178.1 UDP-4-amino-4,6-dideoxy-N-acetyl-beta-L-altrosamine transaminase [Fluviicoccus sp.]